MLIEVRRVKVMRKPKNLNEYYQQTVLNNYKLISELSEQVFILPTRPTNSSDLSNMLLCQSHLAILATKCSI